ncbi:cysteinyl-tRNA synthetase [Opitutaceae bacterium TAV5]|nr:cysteinyl-tRNA synthetase [Opitutaceae bacterium TAV5]
MPLHLYNTLTARKEPVFPADGHTLRFYCCGPTVYAPSHIGNFRSFVVQDVFRRVVEAGGCATLHVRNITDVDDKTVRRSLAEGVSLSAFTARLAARYHDDCTALGLLPPHHEPGAVEHIPDQIALIERLVARGHAWRADDGSVYFDVNSFPEYGRLSRLDRREIRSPAPKPGRAILAEAVKTRTGESSPEDADEYAAREHAADFALWKARKPADGPNYWSSPWGEGRPGWHIECSAMSMRYLGESFDLHSGGADLIFPHHENEIAQSEAATGKPFVRHWFHIAHLLVDGGKMSKSRGTAHTLEDVIARGHRPAELRYALLAGHYRQPLNFTWNSLLAARSALVRLARLLSRFQPAANARQSDIATTPEERFGIFQPVFDALNDDLNTPRALGLLFASIESFESGQAPFTRTTARQLGEIVAIFGFDPDSFTDARPVAGTEIPLRIAALADARQAARREHDWIAADAARNRLREAGWEIREHSDGYRLFPLSRISS